MLRITNLDDVLRRLRSFLLQYLHEKGIDTTRNFQCLNPDHDDTEPSMSCAQDPENAFCYACGATADLLQAASWLEGLPLEGEGFIEETVKTLAARFGVEITYEEMDEDEAYRIRTYKAYADAARLITDSTFGDYTYLNKEIERRKWAIEFLQETKTGTVVYKSFREEMKRLGYEARFQDEIDLGRPDLFSEESLIFTICDEFGRPVGFAARNIGENNGRSKYTNQKTTGVRCNIYQKGRRLYNISDAKKHAPPLYIFEGYADIISARQAGLPNCVAIGGTAFTKQHLQLLKKLNIYDIVLCLDGDPPGQQKTAKLLDEFFSGNRDIRVHIVNLPDELDPDDFFRDYGLEPFLKLKKHTAFEWRLTLFEDDDEGELVCNTMIPLIVNEPNRITQDKMCNTLSEFTGIDKRIILAELERLQNEKEYIKQRETNNIISRLIEDIRLSPTNTRALLYECITNIEQIEEKLGAQDFSPDTIVTFIANQKEHEEQLTGEFAGFYLRPDGLGNLGIKLNGNWREDTFICIGGCPNVGKSSLCCQLLYEIVENPDNNAIGIYHTIDDSKNQILPRFICQAAGDPNLIMNQVRNPNYFKNEVENPEQMLYFRQKGYQTILSLAREGRLFIKGASDGSSLSYGEALIRHLRYKYPDKQIVYVLDNFHKASDFPGQETRIRFKNLSNYAKDLVNKYHMTIICSVEYTKLPPGTIPTDQNIAETRAIMYDALFTGHLYNDMHEKGPMAEYVHKYNGEYYPRVMMNIGKNKISDYKGLLFFDLYPASGIFRMVPGAKAEADRKDRHEELLEAKALMRQKYGKIVYTGTDGDVSWDNDKLKPQDE